MYRPSRTRRILKWTGVGFCLIVIIAWCLTETHELFVRIPGQGVLALSSGFVGYIDAQSSAGWITGIMWKDGYPLEWVKRPPIQRSWLGGYFIANWLLLLVVALPTAWLWHRDRRRIRPGCCIRCGYDLTGNTSGVCSECGEAKRPTPNA